ncbi:MAG: InlB B-repeat-containing protein, partial [Treponema sp.]|nr:InlB B-repeat-containing protein [Treponema sp.]
MRNRFGSFLRGCVVFAGIVALAMFIAGCDDPTRVPEFTVTFNLNGGGGTLPPPQTVNAGSSVTLPNGTGLSRSGFVFAGWNTATDGTGTNHDAGTVFTPTGNVTLFARWNTAATFTVTFNANGGTGTVPAQSTAQDSGMTLPGQGNLTRSGHTFGGWNISASGTGENFGAGTTFTPAGNTTLFARWIVNFTVTFDPNGGTGTMPALTTPQGSGITLPSGAGLKGGYTFGGWNRNAVGTGENFGAGSTFTPTGNVTLFARWIVAGAESFTVTFSANGGGGTAPAPQMVAAGSSIALPSGDGLLRSGFTFGGWNTNADGTGVNHSAGASFTPTENVTLFARWNPVVNFTVTFSANGGSGTVPAPQTVTEGSSITLPSGDGLSKSGLVFDGWNTNVTGMGTNHSVEASFTPTGNVTLFARWIPVVAQNFTVTFHANGGDGTVPAPQTVTEGSSITLPSGVELTKSGFTFGGWNTNTAGTGTSHSMGSMFTPTSNVLLFASWNPVTFKVISAGTDHTAVVKMDGTLWAWGGNASGQLGDGTTTGRNGPVQIQSGMTWASVSAGGIAGASHSVAIRSDGTLWGWGHSAWGQRGDGTTTNRNTPVRVGMATNWISVAAGGAHTIAIRSDGSLWAWGRNRSGQIGDGTTTNRNTPVRIGTATNWASVSAGLDHTVAV